MEFNFNLGEAASNGGHPSAGLIEGSDGNFYGTTEGAVSGTIGSGLLGFGTIFKMTPAGVLTTLVQFTGNDAANKGSAPAAGLLLGSDGNFYGTTSSGGAFGNGTVFKMTTAGVLTTLVEFTGNGAVNKGASPKASLTKGNDGNFYGTTSGGGAFGYGTVFKMTSAGALTTLVEFTGNGAANKGSAPMAGLTLENDGSFYGTTSSGGGSDYGTLFRMTPSGALTTLVNFVGGGSRIGFAPKAGLVQTSDGNFYGTTSQGGRFGSAGTVFKMTPAGTLTTLVEFTGNGGSSPGVHPYAGLVQGNDGNFYGTTHYGGTYGSGTVFRMSPAGLLNTIFSFAPDLDTRGSNPYAGLVRDDDGNFYGTTYDGGAVGFGTVFKVTPAGALTTLVQFTYNGAINRGWRSIGNLLRGSDGNYYGTTSDGGIAGHGTVFKMTPGGALTTLVDFTGDGAVNSGWSPRAGLSQGSDGNFYGTTVFGGLLEQGTVFKMTPAGALTTLVDFTGTNGANKGAYPASGVIQTADGNFYGTTPRGGAHDFGTLFQMTPGGGLTTLKDFSSAEDGHPSADLIRGMDGNLYGTTSGPPGSVYRLLFPGPPLLYLREGTAPDTTSAFVEASVNPRGAVTTVQLEFGTDGVSFPSIIVITSNLNGYQSHSLGRTLRDLNEGAVYYYRFRAVSSAGATVSPVRSFATLAVPGVVTGSASSITAASARLNGTVNARNYESAVVFEWGTDGNSFPHTLPAAPVSVTGNAPVNVSADIAGLSRGTSYFYRIKATSAGGATVSGTQSFLTLTEPVAGVSGAIALSTTRAQVFGWVNAMGPATAVTFDYGTAPGALNNHTTAVPGTVSGTGNTPVSAELPGLTQGVTYYFRITGVSAGGTGVSPDGTFTLGILSGLQQTFPDPPQPSQGSVRADLTPAGVGGWRFSGEQQWRAPGETAAGLTTGDRIVVFRPVSGFVPPPQEIVSVISGAPALVLARTYYTSPVADGGALSVTIKPDSIAAQAGWRLAGETTWKASGTTVAGLAPGTWLVEARPVAGRATPPVAAVRVEKGVGTQKTLTYFLADAQSGTAPGVLTFQTVSTNEAMPYAFAGQLRSQSGSGTGFVVKRRVVATAAHMVWDDGTLSAVTGLQWLFQRDRGTYEPRPQIPRGIYMSDGYASQRIADSSPGSSSPQSQNLDYAVLYFTEEAGRGGAGGFLASDSADNEFLLSGAQKLLAGYPVDGITALNQGRMHATPPANVPFLQAFGKTYTTSAIHSYGGNSGGPLCVQHTNGKYYPAAIYLGGSSQTVVRAIDSTVVDLIARAEVSANGGANNTGGGITHTSVTPFGTTDQPGTLIVILEPAAARSAGAGWRLSPETPYRQSGQQNTDLTAGTYTLQLKAVAGFDLPADQPVTITGGQQTTITFTYASGLSPLDSWRQTHFGTTANTGNASDNADPDGDGRRNIDEYAAGTNPNSSADLLKVLTVTRTGSTCEVTVAGKAARRYQLQRTTNAATGPWTNIGSSVLQSAAANLSLTDPASPPAKAYYRVLVSP